MLVKGVFLKKNGLLNLAHKYLAKMEAKQEDGWVCRQLVRNRQPPKCETGGHRRH